MAVRRNSAPDPATIKVGLTDDHLDEAGLRAFSEHTLAAIDELQAERHLARCEDCAAKLEALSKKDPLVGTMLGEYRVLAPLSEGGMSAIYRGEQPTIGKAVAIKVLLPHMLGDPDQVARLLAEARAVNAIHHPNIIDIFSFGSLPTGGQYFVMELLEGKSAMQWVEDKGRFTPGEVLTVLEQTFGALAAAHARNVLHRDLKPSNLFITTLADQSWHVTVLDFGLAKQLGKSSSTNPDLVVGTPGFMAPEQIRGEPLTPACDLYAMGCVAWALLTAEEAFDAETGQDLMYKHLEESHPPLSEAAPDCPAPLADLVHRLLEKKPEKRPASAREVLKELARIRLDMRGSETAKVPVLKDRPGVRTKPSRPAVMETTDPEFAAVSREEVPTKDSKAVARSNPPLPAQRGEGRGEGPAVPWLPLIVGLLGLIALGALFFFR